MLKAFTGSRNSELFLMKWSMVKYVGNKPMYIMSPNNKLNQLQKNSKEFELQSITLTERKLHGIWF